MLPAATADALGGAKVGDYLDIAPDGTLSGKTPQRQDRCRRGGKSEPWRCGTPMRSLLKDSKLGMFRFQAMLIRYALPKASSAATVIALKKKALERGGTTIYNCNNDFTITFQTNGILHVACLSKNNVPSGTLD